MIIVTELHYVEGSGESWKDVEYKDADNYVASHGHLTLWKEPTIVNDPIKYQVQYNEGSWVRVIKK